MCGFVVPLLTQRMANAMLVIPDSIMHFSSAQLDPFVVVTNVNASPVTLHLHGIIMFCLEDSHEGP